MDTRVNIYRRELPRGKRPPSVRFVCITCLETVPDVSYWALVDTGASFSIVPSDLWEKEDSKIDFVEGHNWNYIYGITDRQDGTGKEDRRVPCKLGWLHIKLADRRGSRSAPLTIRALLAGSNAVPLILGVADFLDAYRVTLNEEGDSYIVVPGL